jgi:hypothetical protein
MMRMSQQGEMENKRRVNGTDRTLRPVPPRSGLVQQQRCGWGVTSAIVDTCGRDWPKTEGYDVRTPPKTGAYSLGPNFAHLTGGISVNPG